MLMFSIAVAISAPSMAVVIKNQDTQMVELSITLNGMPLSKCAGGLISPGGERQWTTAGSSSDYGYCGGKGPSYIEVYVSRPVMLPVMCHNKGTNDTSILNHGTTLLVTDNGNDIKCDTE